MLLYIMILHCRCLMFILALDLIPTYYQLFCFFLNTKKNKNKKHTCRKRKQKNFLKTFLKTNHLPQSSQWQKYCSWPSLLNHLGHFTTFLGKLALEKMFELSSSSYNFNILWLQGIEGVLQQCPVSNLSATAALLLELSPLDIWNLYYSGSPTFLLILGLTC